MGDRDRERCRLRSRFRSRVAHRCSPHFGGDVLGRDPTTSEAASRAKRPSAAATGSPTASSPEPASRPVHCRGRTRARTPCSLYQAFQQHLETYLALAGEDDWDGQDVPAHVKRGFRRYLECGLLANGLAQARCPECGHDFLAAFSCKGRGLCPSRNARRMAEPAAHVVDHVIPPLPVRQWVISAFKRLRLYVER
jgi:hypothetical protein